MSRRAAAWLPDPSQALLLTTALASRLDDAVAAWAEWKSRVRLEDIDPASHQLLPLVYRNLTRLDVEDDALGKLRGTYRYAWSRNQLLIRTGATALRLLEQAGIETMVLKGAALGALHYRDPGARPMVDFDLLVPRHRALDAFAALTGPFRPHELFPRPEQRLSVHHSTPFVDGSGHELDVHWYSLWQSAPDDDFWGAAVPVDIAGVGSRALCPADQLLHTCSHGAWWSPGHAVRWVADAITVIESSGQGLDWDRFAERARARRLGTNLLEPVEYLGRGFGVDVPAEVVASLRREPATRLERGACRAGRSPSSPRRILLIHLERYRRLKRLDPAAPRARSFLSHLRTSLGHNSYLELSRHAGRRLVGIRR